MHDSRWWLVSYDVHNAKRLRKCAHLLEGYGERLQLSVFRCWMSRTRMEELRWKLTELLDPEDDVLLIPLCGDCVKGIIPLRTQDEFEWPPAPPRYLII